MGQFTLTDQEQHLLTFFKQLDEPSRHSLIRFAEFLASETTISDLNVKKGSVHTAQVVPIKETESQPVNNTNQAVPPPEDIERPPVEMVVDAIKRMSATYPMVDKKTVLDKSAGLVADHVMHGQPARVVIDKLEKLFREAYEKLVNDSENQ